MDLVTQIPMTVIVAAIVGFLRSFTGWLENSLKDNIISPFEIRQLAGTIVKYMAAIMLLMLGVDSILPIFVDSTTTSSAAAAVPIATSIAFGLDVVTSALKKGAINGK